MIAAARSQMTASFPRDIFSQAEIAGDDVIPAPLRWGARLTDSRCGFSPAGPGPAHDIIADRRRRSRSGRVHEHEEMTGLAGRSGGQYSFLNAK